MESSITMFKRMLPELLKQCSGFVQIDLSIKLFGVKVFSFTWPPTAEKSSNNE